MKKTIYMFITLFLIGPSIHGQENNPNVSIKTNMPNSIIFVDNNFAGEGETSINLKEGVHYIKIKDEAHKWDAEIIRDTIFISKSDEIINLNYSFSSEYFLDSDPQDAVVYKNDIKIGHTPLFVHNGTVNVSLFKKDYQTKVINLKKIPAVHKINLDFVGKEKSKSFAETAWFEVLIGTAVVFGATAAHFKIQADKEYDKYLETNNRQHLDETDKLDLYSGLAFGALQINFGYLIYRLITD